MLSGYGGVSLKMLINNSKGKQIKKFIPYLILASLFITSLIFVHYNHNLYQQPIAEVIEMDISDENTVTGVRDVEDKVFTQEITGMIKNGTEQGNEIQLKNTYTSSGAYDQEFNIGDEIFITIHKDKQSQVLTGTIKDVKRDKYIVLVAWVFIITLLLIGKRQGLFSIIGLVINVALLSFALD